MIMIKIIEVNGVKVNKITESRMLWIELKLRNAIKKNFP